MAKNTELSLFNIENFNQNQNTCINEYEYEYDSTNELKNNIYDLFSKIFEYENQKITVMGNINGFYFKARDILKILKCTNKKTIKMFLSNLDNNLKISLKDLLTLDPKIKILQDISHNESKEIYLTEIAIYFLIIKTNNSDTKKFQDFLLNELFPTLRKIIYNDLIDNIVKRDATINSLIFQKSEISENNEILEAQLNNILKLNRNLEYQNNQLIYLNKRQNLDYVDSDNVCLLTDENEKSLKYYFVLFEDRKNNRFFFIHGKKHHINQKLRKVNKYKIIITMQNYSHFINFINKLKEISYDLDKDLNNKIKHKIQKKYPDLTKEQYNEKYKSLYNKYKLFNVKFNELVLNNSNIIDIIEIYEEFISKEEFIEKYIDEEECVY